MLAVGGRTFVPVAVASQGVRGGGVTIRNAQYKPLLGAAGCPQYKKTTCGNWGCCTFSCGVGTPVEPPGQTAHSQKGLH